MMLKIDVVAPSVCEYTSHRLWSGERFGIVDTAWATRVGITVANASIKGRGRAYWTGVGDWKMPRLRKHPVPLDLVVELDVVSTRWAREHPASDDDRRLVLDAWDLAPVTAYVEEHASLQDVPMDAIQERLHRYFDVEVLD